MPDVRMPDGTIIKNVPQGATRAQIEAAHRKARSAGAAPDKRPTSFLQGVLDGVSKPLTNTAQIFRPLQGAMPQFRALGDLGMVADAMQREQADKAPSRGSTAGRVTGGILGTLPTAFMPGGAILQGVAGGVLSTNDLNDKRGMLRDATIGGVFGKGGEVVGRRVLAPVAERIGRTAPARAVGEAAVRAVNKVTGGNMKPLPLPKIEAAERQIKSVAPELAQVRQQVSDAADLNLPFALADADPRLQQLAGSATRFSPDARKLAAKNFNERADDKSVRAIRGINDHLAPPVDIKQRSDDLIQAARNKSRPIYERSFQGGSMAPLETQLGDAFNETSQAVARARQALAAAQRDATLTAGQVSRSGDNVYQNAQALPKDRAAGAAIANAERGVTQAESAHAQTLEMLRRAQGDAASDAPGAVWSPRLQQFLDDPIAQSGLSRGMEIQRLEALKNGKPFDPTELAITGMDEAGKPIVGKVPNMRTVDAVKKGLDAHIDDYPKDFRNAPILDERGREIQGVLKAYRGEADRLNPEYGEARGTYQRYAKVNDALHQGYKAADESVFDRDLQKLVSGYRPAERAQSQAGYTTALRDGIAKTRNSGADPYRLVHGGVERPLKMRTMFPEGEARFARQHELEDLMAATRTEALGGSQTQGRNIADQSFMTGSDVAGDMAMDALSGGVPGVSTLARVAMKATLGDRRKLGMFAPKKRADQLAPLLLDTGHPGAVRDQLDDLLRRFGEDATRKIAYGKGLGLLGNPLASGSVAFSNR